MKKEFYFSMMFIGFFSYSTFSQSVITKYLEFGSHTVGYEVIHTYDNSRSFFPKYDYYGNRTHNPIGRPMQISLWFPAKKNSSSQKIKYKDYIGYSSSQIDFSKKSSHARAEAIGEFYNNIDSSKYHEIEKLLNNDTNAYLNADELADDFPIILYAPPMNTSSTDNSIICEYLVSKGFIVLSVMAKGEYSLLQNRSIRDVHAQAEDLAYLLDFAKKRYSTDKIGTLGFSLGGLSNIIFASKNRDVDATVSLDGSIMSQGWLDLIKGSEFYNPDEFTSNLLLIGKNLKAPDQNPAAFYDSLRYSDKALIRYDHSEHGYFSGINLLYQMTVNEKFPELEKEQNYVFYAEMTQYIGDFFDKYLKNFGSFDEYQEKKFNHSFNYKRGQRKPIEQGYIGQLIIEKGYDYTQKVIEDIQKYENNYLESLDWRVLLNTSIALQNKGRSNEAINTLLLSNKAFPKWYITNYELGKIYLSNGDKQEASKYFKYALKDNPRHYDSIDALKQLNEEVMDYHNEKVDNLTPYLGTYIVDENRYREIYIKDGSLYLASNYWDEPVELWPYSSNLFLVENDNPRYNMQILFNQDEDNNIVSLAIRGLNSGRINPSNIKVKS